MAFYFVLFILACVVPIAGRSATKIMALPFVFYAVWLVGLRDGIGTDWNTYEVIFESIKYGESFWEVTDLGYGLLNLWFADVPLGMYFVNLICAALMITGVYFYSMRFSMSWLALFIAASYLVIIVGMGYTRQAAATGLLYIGLMHLFAGGRFLFVFFVVVASLFHAPAVIFLLYMIASLDRKNIFRFLMVSAPLKAASLF